MKQKAVILGIELSNINCAVGLLYNEKITELCCSNTGLKSQKILSMIEQILEQNNLSSHQLTALAFGAGPGSFTGLKIASCVMQGLHLAWGKPIIKISTLWALALQGSQQFGVDYLVPCIDAKMGQVYYGIYKVTQGDVPVSVQQDSIIDPKMLNLPQDGTILVIGDGAEVVKNYVSVNTKTINSQISAASIVKLAGYCYKINNGIVLNNDAEPIYLKLYD